MKQPAAPHRMIRNTPNTFNVANCPGTVPGVWPATWSVMPQRLLPLGIVTWAWEWRSITGRRAWDGLTHS